MMKVTLRISSLFFGLVLWSATAWAQPANDLCSGAIDLIVYDSEAEAIPVDGDTRNATDGALDNIPVCSANAYRDDVWYKVTFPAVLEDDIYAFRVYFGEEATDVSGFGIALYNSCDADPGNVALFCQNEPSFNQGELCGALPNQTVYVRVWSITADATDWLLGAGTFRIAVFPKPYDSDFSNSIVLWGNQPGQGDFNGGLNNWTTEGISCNGTPAESALWAWNATGLPFWYFGGQEIFDIVEAIKSRTSCNGSVIFDSALLNLGEDQMGGPCPWMEHEGALISPVIDLSENNSAGISLIFNQSMQRFSGGEHWIDYSLDGGLTYTEIQINTEKTQLTNASTDAADGYYNEEFRVLLPDAENAENLRIRFRFKGGAYWWIIDDVRIVETEANNIRVQSNFFAIAPWAILPVNQIYPFGALADVANIGASDQTNVVLNHTVVNSDTQVEIYNESLVYGTVVADSVYENRLNPTLIELPAVAATYTGTYTLTQNETDFDDADNTISFNYSVGGNTFALEDGATRAVALANGIYDDGAPLSYALGNYFRPVEDDTVKHIVWGVANAAEMVDRTVQIYLIQWTDTNGDLIAESNERRFIGLSEYTFTGTEGDDAILEATLENFDNPGDPIIMKAGFGYFAIVEYQASSADDPQFFLLASENYNYGAAVLASDSAVALGLADQRVFSTVLGFSPDGNIADIDYEVRELGANRVFLGHGIIPLVRIVVESTVNTVDPLPLDNAISAYPNPATDMLQVKLEFSQPYSDVKLRLIDNLGRVVYYKALNQTITTHVEAVSVSDLSSGNYMLQVETIDGQRSIPVVVVK